jgi:hypothetical protein
MIHNLQKSAKETHFDKNISGLSANNVQGAIDELKSTIGYSKKNLLKYPYYETTKEGKGIAYTDNGDGRVTANGTATGNIGFNFFYRLGTRLTLKAGTYIYYGCPKGGSESTYYMDIAKVVNDTNVTLGVDIGDGVTFVLDEDSELALSAIVMVGTTVNNLVFEPMIVPASLGKIPFEPYVADVKNLIKTYETDVVITSITVGNFGDAILKRKDKGTLLSVTPIITDSSWVSYFINYIMGDNICVRVRNHNTQQTVSPQVRAIVTYLDI